MKFIKIGFGNMVSSDRIIAIVGPESSPVKRMIQDAKDRSTLIDATSGRKTKSVIMMDSDHLVLSSLSTDELSKEMSEE